MSSPFAAMERAEAREGKKLADAEGKMVRIGVTFYKPTRRRDESPVDYHKRTGCAPNDFMKAFKGKFYCNPAHCHRAFTSKAERDKHVDLAYAALD